MKRAFYISLMSLLGMMMTASIYYCIIFGIVSNRLVHWYYLECFLDITLSIHVMLIVALIGVLIGYRAGKKWWQIIYVDGVYYFNKALSPIDTTEAPLTPRRRRMQKPVKKAEK